MSTADVNHFFKAAILTVAAALFPACGGRTGLTINEYVVPADPDTPCPGWPGEFFLTYARTGTNEGTPTAMALYPSNGDGTFDAAHTIDMKGAFSGVVVDDFDRDGSLEIHLWLSLTGVEYVLDYSCAEGMWLMTPNFSGSEPPRHNFSTFGDVNNDGYIDVVGWIPVNDADGEPNADALDVYTSLGGPGGTFIHQKSELNLKQTFVYWLAAPRHVRDMDNDGCADLVYIRYDHGGTAKSTVYLARGDCAGHFAQPNGILKMPFPGTGDDIGDVDGDGFMDLISGLDDDGDPGQTWVAKGNGAGDLESPIEVFDVVKEESGHDDSGFGGVFLYDWDHDGQQDALSGYTTGGNFTSPQIDIRMNRGDLEFGAPALVVPPPLAIQQWFVGPASK